MEPGQEYTIPSIKGLTVERAEIYADHGMYAIWFTNGVYVRFLTPPGCEALGWVVSKANEPVMELRYPLREQQETDAEPTT